MRIILVGPPHARAQLRLELVELHGHAIDVVGEFDTLAKARASAVKADAMLLANDDNDGSSPQNGSSQHDEWIDEELTPREIEVLELLAEGLPNKAIGVRLKISDQTVKFHVASIIGKLGASNRTDAVRLAVRRGLISM
jgi:DNA-binding NarL/FixJ family response regulator